MSLEIELNSEHHSDDSYSYNYGMSSKRGQEEEGGIEEEEEEYIVPSSNDLTIATGAALIVADCMGTGILALPFNINKTLGRDFGLFFLFLNLIINLYAGTILCNVALLVEKRLSLEDNGNSIASTSMNGMIVGSNNGSHNLTIVSGGEGDYGQNNNLNREGMKKINSNKKLLKPRSLSTSSMESYNSIESRNSNDWKYDSKSNDKKKEEQEGETREKIQINSTRKDSYDAMTTPNTYNSEDEENHRYYLKKLTTSNNNNHQNEYNNQPVSHQNNNRHHTHGDAHTFDFIGMTTALFDYCADSYNDCSNHQQQTQRNNNDHHYHHQQQQRPKTSYATILVLITYYTNIFLVLGNYILVMSHAVAAMIGENLICIPNAGLIASTLMFGLCQFRSMSSLGHGVSFISLASLAIVVVQCLASIYSGNDAFEYGGGGGFGERVLLQEETNILYDRSLNEENENDDINFFQALARQFAALSSIGFAVGSQKLLLNIRHEYKDRTQAAPQSLGISLFAFGVVYALVCILSGPNPPSFLFDAVSIGNGRRIAGFLLWIHVAVSYAINSQALCSSIDRIKFHHITLFSLHKYHRVRWAIITFMVSLSSFFIANGVPFFRDLVSLIGALTSVPLTLLLPAVYHRKIKGLPLFCLSFHSTLRRQEDIWSFLLVVFSVIFLICGVVGSIRSIALDWSNHGAPFSCH